MRVRLLCLVALLAFACSAPPTSPAAGPPLPPLTVEPFPEPARGDLASLPPDELSAGGLRLLQQGRPAEAAQVLYFAVKQGADDRYNLACALARANEVDPAFYWLQRAAAEEGVDSEWAQQDSDLDNLRADPRWSQVADYLRAYNEYFAHQDVLRTVLIVPAGYAPDKPIVTLVGMHGLGGSEAFVHEDYRLWAERLNVAFVGLSGTRPLGPKSCSWSEDRELDHAQVQKALASLQGRLEPGKVLLFGFSQGAQMAFELAAAHPDRYAGAIVMSPGKRGTGGLEGLKARAGNQDQRFVLVSGAEEHPGTVAQVREDASWARAGGAEVKEKLYPGVSEHAFPPDFTDAFPDWVRWLESAGR